MRYAPIVSLGLLVVSFACDRSATSDARVQAPKLDRETPSSRADAKSADPAASPKPAINEHGNPAADPDAGDRRAVPSADAVGADAAGGTRPADGVTPPKPPGPGAAVPAPGGPATSPSGNNDVPGSGGSGGATVNDPTIVAKVKQKYGDQCRPERVCRHMLGIDCNAAADGPYYYIDLERFEELAVCGGACMMGNCKNCPPKGWDCPVY